MAIHEASPIQRALILPAVISFKGRFMPAIWPDLR
jgi:hypothetical protein